MLFCLKGVYLDLLTPNLSALLVRGLSGELVVGAADILGWWVLRLGEVKDLSQDCVVCKQIRYFFFAATPIIVMIGMGGNTPVSEFLDYIRVDLKYFMANLILLALAVLIVVRVYVEYYKPWRDKPTKKLSPIIADKAQEE